MIKTVLEFLNEISLPKPDKNSYAANFLKLYENGSEATYVHITKENAYGKEYLQISSLPKLQHQTHQPLRLSQKLILNPLKKMQIPVLHPQKTQIPLPIMRQKRLQ